MRVALDKGAFVPERAHEDDAGYDIKTPVPVVVGGHNFKGDGTAIINTGVHVEIPRGYAGFLKSKSGLNVKNGLTGEGLIDSGYTGAIIVKLYNHTDQEVHFAAGDKIIQLVLLPIYTPAIEVVESLEQTARGDDGFGSTGR